MATHIQSFDYEGYKISGHFNGTHVYMQAQEKTPPHNIIPTFTSPLDAKYAGLDIVNTAIKKVKAKIDDIREGNSNV